MSRRERSRIDSLLVSRGLVESRTKAQALILAAKVEVDGRVVDKAGTEVYSDAEIKIKEGLPFVGRGGTKLEGALSGFSISVEGLTIIDVGSSTGGFTDCLLQQGAKKVFAVDVGRGLLDWKLRKDERVTVLEGENIRYLDPGKLDELADIAVIDVSFISVKKVLPIVKTLVKEGSTILALIKPQFEVGKGEVGKGGIVKDPEKHRQVVESIKEFSASIGLKPLSDMESPIKGAKGNREFWLHLLNG